MKKFIKFFVFGCISWLLGYLGGWLGKWTLASIILKRNVFADAIDNILIRTSPIVENPIVEAYLGEHNKYFLMIVTLFTYFINKWTLILSLLLMFASIYSIVVYRKSFKLPKALFFIIVSTIPFVWAYLVQNHTYEHMFMTYRIFITCYFSLMSMIIMLFSNNLNKLKKER